MSKQTSYLVAVVLFGVVGCSDHDASTQTQVGNCEGLREAERGRPVTFPVRQTRRCSHL